MGTVDGSVVWWNNEEGWGALRSDDVPSEVFVHFSDLVMDGYRSLREGATVQFEVEDFPSGQDGYVYRAHRVVLINLLGQDAPSPVR